LLLSARQTNAIFYVDRMTGEILWKIGGSTYSKDGEPRLQVVSDPETAFNLQHDARWLPNGDITLFDDHGATPGVGRGVEYAIDHDANTATFVFQFLGSTQSQYAGSFRRYADGSSVIGWGSVPTDPRILTEIDAKGADVLDVSLGGQVSYRAVKVAISQLDIATLRATAGK
jgi:arylsulfotransferase ASST